MVIRMFNRNNLSCKNNQEFFTSCSYILKMYPNRKILCDNNFQYTLQAMVGLSFIYATTQ